ncbi:LpxI family protein [Niveispirillum irakense]|uniref:LpxI family protein n=1 Tax=Niveispirillum irakense TaxID=34011 RepID=UPI00040EBF91|nr:UDP-2,3-diacylglucosamine diphosphatase LpxI [Niveispirillum irakense]
MAPKLGILAGGGDLPANLVETCRRDGRDFFLIALEGQATPEWLSPDIPHAWFRLGAAGAILDRLKAEGVGDIVMAGRVRRPSLTELRPDWKATQFFARIGLKALGDDGLLRGVAQVLEEEGFRVVGVQTLITGLLTPEGPLGTHRADEQALADIAHGITVARALGGLDIGQSVVVQQGVVLGVEAIEGTDALIQRCGALRRPGPGPVLVKCAKPQQDRRLDLPALGPDTVDNCIAAGFAGIAAQAGNTLFLGRDKAVTAADAAGLFLLGITP